MGYILIILFFVLLSGRLSLVFDIFSNIQLDSRFLTKIVWLPIYLLILAVILFIRQNGRKRFINELRAKIFQYKGLIISLEILFILLFVGLPFSRDFNVSLMGYGYYLILASILFLPLLLLKKTDSDLIRKGINIITITLVIVGLFQLIDFRINQHHGWFISLFNHGGFVPATGFVLRTKDWGVFLRPSSLMIDPNIFSVFLSLSLVIAWDSIVKNVSKPLSIITLVLSLAMLIITNSRTGLLGLIVGIAVYIGAKYIYKKNPGANGKKKTMSLLPVLIERFSFKDLSAQEHINYWIQSIKIGLKYPLWGIGIGNFPYYYRANINPKVTFATPHSVYAQFLSESGFTGLLGLLFFLLVYLLTILKRQSALILSLFAILVVSNVTYDFLMTPWVWFLLGVFISDIDW